MGVSFWTLAVVVVASLLVAVENLLTLRRLERRLDLEFDELTKRVNALPRSRKPWYDVDPANKGK